MLTHSRLEEVLISNKEIQNRLKTLELAQKLNPHFKTPHIVGGYLRNIYFKVPPKDCDVVFCGKELNQGGILEAVREAERQLNIDPYLGWEFENALATGMSDDFYENTIGRFSHHTDYLTLLLIDTNGNLHLGDDKTLHDFEHKIFDLRFSGVEIWANHRGKGRSYESSLVGDLIRGLYLCPLLSVTHSAIAAFLTGYFDTFYYSLDEQDRAFRHDFWMKKTNGDKFWKPILQKFNINSLEILDTVS